MNIKPPCDYNSEGIDSVRCLDFEDLNGLRFLRGGLYDSCMVTAVMRAGDWIEIDAPGTVAKYTSALQKGIYTHTLGTFVGDLSADLAATLHLASKKRLVTFFRAKSGRCFCFGYEAGGVLTYTNQTADSIGSMVTITASSVYPLFEVSPAAFTESKHSVEFVPDFDRGAFCEIL